MLEFQEKRKVKKFMYSKITLLILIIILFLILKAVWGVYEKQQFTKDNLDRVKADYNELSDREQKLSKEIDWLKTENGVEQEIRDKYGLVKPSEEVIIIVDKSADSNSNSDQENKGFWQKVLLWLK